MDREDKHIEVSLQFLTIPTTFQTKDPRMPDLAMCNATNCANSKTCRRSPDSGTVPDVYRQTWTNFMPEEKDGKRPDCHAYWMVPMDVIRERRRAN